MVDREQLELQGRSMSLSAQGREEKHANVGMKSALFPADWQFQSPIERERAGGGDLDR